jgi:hypothetical protein
VKFTNAFCKHDSEEKPAQTLRLASATYLVGSSDFDIFFRNSICFMCFWFGLEILRLVYKKVFFEILNGFYLI